MRLETGLILIHLWSLATLGAPGAGIVGSPHDLSASSGGDACRYCHTPHSTAAPRPGWSQQLSQTVYRIYQSSSLEAQVGQPTGASKMCLSCHDGTVALPFDSSGGGMPGAFVAPGQANLGTDLSDDHPISFVYSDALVVRDTQLRPVATLPEPLKLDRNGELQCTTCHNPHDNQHGDFLVLPNQRSEMCTHCHRLNGWVGSSHEQAAASVGGSRNDYLTRSGFHTVADLGCQSCHRPHGAGGHERLLHYARAEDNCLGCHDGTVARTNIQSQLRMSSRHDMMAYRDIHDIRESPLTSPRHVECSDCHNPHASLDLPAQAPLVPGSMQKVQGVTAAGGIIQQVRYEYEVCFKCHADNPNRVDTRLDRVITQTNTRLEFDTTGPSYHPVIAPGVNKQVPSLRSPLTVSSIIYCTDCHGSSTEGEARGPHGSIYAPILKAHYETSDFTTESPFAYALCYDCHSRNSILGNESFPGHRRHLDARIPCSACHDAHGISSAQGSRRNHTHLINFDAEIVAADPNSGRLEFEDLGIYQGRCTLLCHGRPHSPEEY
jgi:predicted CXXCH cytochrome family protein